MDLRSWEAAGLRGTWGRQGSNLRPTDYESPLNAMPLTRINATRRSKGSAWVMALVGPGWTREDVQTWNKCGTPGRVE